MSLPKQAAAQDPLILGGLDHIDHGIIRGWAIDRLNPGAALAMRVTIDDSLAGVIHCDLPRQDLNHLHLPATEVGFEYGVPARFRDGRRHVLALSSLAGAPIQLPDPANRIYREIHFVLAPESPVDGVIDGLVDGMVQGWALQPGAAGGTGGVRLLACVDGQPVAEVYADQFRADLADAGSADPCCGFAFAVPAALGRGRTVRLEIHAMPGRHALRNSPMEIFLPAEPERGRISALLERADELFRFAHDLRQELRAALPAERHSLADYESWAHRNGPRIGPRAAACYGEIAGAPLVSVLCPVYRPDPAAFLAAVDSVAAQTYRNWELILVDDASANAPLTGILSALAKDDPRRVVLVQPENTGIGAALNRALAAARGEVVVFLDHDDVLDANALEVMLRARSATGARLLYSDEDKINSAGRLSQPHFKSDFNYRLLLEQNYICHLTMVETALARDAGGFDKKFDGAQDHDFLLRVSERLSPHEIHHVSEILYHWRISQNSTAQRAGAKPHARRAGELAVASHLRRRKIAAKTRSRGDLTCYRSEFALTGDPGVSILVPFKDQVELTQNCVTALRETVRNLRYEIILLDNGSNSAAAEAFCAQQGNLDHTRIIRIAGAFNFSRINNTGMRAAKYPFVLFLNNDVLVQGANWLRIMLNEALADGQVAAVGAKLLYPDGNIQHAGVVLGVGGVGDHAFRGLDGAAPGYMAQAICAREVSAVTAACMLVRAQAFAQAGGFDELELGVAFNDIDLCLKFREAGYKIIYTPDAVARHYESVSRGNDFEPEKLGRFMRENAVMMERWRHLLPHDPFYNRHFSRDGGIYRDLRVAEPLAMQPAKTQIAKSFSGSFSSEKEQP